MSDEPEPASWHVCCSKTEPSFVKYVAQLMVTAAVLGLAVYKLSIGSTDALYSSLLTLILGVYVPTPTHDKANSNRQGT